MGTILSALVKKEERVGRAKLQAQHIPPFDGNAIKWHKWKTKAKAAMGSAGLLKLIDDETYAISHNEDNETIFHLLQVCTADGNVAHLVDKHEDDRDGRAAIF